MPLNGQSGWWWFCCEELNKVKTSHVPQQYYHVPDGGSVAPSKRISFPSTGRELKMGVCFSDKRINICVLFKDCRFLLSEMSRGSYFLTENLIRLCANGFVIIINTESVKGYLNFSCLFNLYLAD